MVRVAFGSTRLSQTLSQRLRLGATIAVFLFVMGLLMQVADSQETKGATRTDGGGEITIVEDLYTVGVDLVAPAGALEWRGVSEAMDELATGQPTRVRSIAGDRDYTFGSIDLAGFDLSGGVAQSSVIGPLALSSASVSGGGTTAGSGRGGTTTDPGGTEPGKAKPVAVAEEAAPLNVPETSSTALLLILALLSIVGLNLLVTRGSRRPSRFR